MLRIAVAFLIAFIATAQAKEAEQRWILIYAGCVSLPSGHESCSSFIQRTYYPSKAHCELLIPQVMDVNAQKARELRAAIFWQKADCDQVGAYKPPA